MTPYDQWLQFVDRWRGCQDCPLCTQRDHIVLARGSVPADVLLLGEAPGVSEDASGLPFDGPAGQLLDGIIASVRSSTRVVFTEALTNCVCCFPREAKQTDDHRPQDDEVEACMPRLREFVELVRPKLVVTVGDTAETWGPVALRGYKVEWCHIVHPAAILRTPLVQRSMMVRKCVAVIRDAVEKHCD